MLRQWEREFPGRTESIFSALRHVELAHLADPRHFDFAALERMRIPLMSERDEQALERTLAVAEPA
jgi:tRNA 2-thiocytidine biosynthesis protein TtcA